MNPVEEETSVEINQIAEDLDVGEINGNENKSNSQTSSDSQLMPIEKPDEGDIWIPPPDENLQSESENEEEPYPELENDEEDIDDY